MLNRLIDTTERSGSMEVRFRHADGAWRRLELNAVRRFALSVGAKFRLRPYLDDYEGS